MIDYKFLRGLIVSKSNDKTFSEKERIVDFKAYNHIRKNSNG